MSNEMMTQMNRAASVFCRAILAPTGEAVSAILMEYIGGEDSSVEERSERLVGLALVGPIVLAVMITMESGATGRDTALAMGDSAEVEHPHHVFMARLTVARLNHDKANWDALVGAHFTVHGKTCLSEVVEAALEFVDDSSKGFRKRGQVLRRLSKLGS